MRVRIQYTVELDDVPNKVSELIREACDKISRHMDNAYGCVSMLQHDSDSIGAAEAVVDSFRQTLSSADQILADSQSILAGFREAKDADAQAKLPSQGETVDVQQG